ncbi:hypothetical protein [Mucilaginibacter kameinonensis]|uniref:hypothetical protein n=1 Tax=Mucilaginibacter kameinonensis TaxID=452286 RepID=UPI000EF84C4E|nr:hypothetical protein [Mucilaginibacter kameinonensis]
MTNKFTFIYLKFILAITFFLLSYNSFSKHNAITFKAIAFAVVAIAWTLLGIYNFKKWKVNNGVDYK